MQRALVRKIRVLHCMRAPVGGLFRHVRDLATEQSARGHAVGIIADATACDPLTAERLEAVRPALELGLHLLPMNRNPGLADVSAALATRAIAERTGADVIHGHGAKGGLYARLAATASRAGGRRVACFYTPHGGALHYGPDTLKGRLFACVEGLMARLTDGLVFESDFARRRYEALVGAAQVARRVVPNGLLAAEFQPRTLRPDAADFLYVGELRILKGVDVLIEAMRCVVRQRRAKLVVVGDGPDRKTFELMVADADLAGAIEFVGVGPARKAFTMGRTLIVPSRAESLPYIVLEAAAAGVPFLATNVGGIPEIVAGSGISLLAPGDSAALARAMLAAMDGKPQLCEQTDRLGEIAAVRFSVTAMTDGVLDFYRDRLAVAERLSIR